MQNRPQQMDTGPDSLPQKTYAASDVYQQIGGNPPSFYQRPVVYNISYNNCTFAAPAQQPNDSDIRAQLAALRAKLDEITASQEGPRLPSSEQAMQTDAPSNPSQELVQSLQTQAAESSTASAMQTDDQPNPPQEPASCVQGEIKETPSEPVVMQGLKDSFSSSNAMSQTAMPKEDPQPQSMQIESVCLNRRFLSEWTKIANEMKSKEILLEEGFLEKVGALFKAPLHHYDGYDYYSLKIFFSDFEETFILNLYCKSNEICFFEPFEKGGKTIFNINLSTGYKTEGDSEWKRDSSLTEFGKQLIEACKQKKKKKQGKSVQPASKSTPVQENKEQAPSSNLNLSSASAPAPAKSLNIDPGTKRSSDGDGSSEPPVKKQKISRTKKAKKKQPPVADFVWLSDLNELAGILLKAGNEWQGNAKPTAEQILEKLLTLKVEVGEGLYQDLFLQVEDERQFFVVHNQNQHLKIAFIKIETSGKKIPVIEICDEVRGKKLLTLAFKGDEVLLSRYPLTNTNWKQDEVENVLKIFTENLQIKKVILETDAPETESKMETKEDAPPKKETQKPSAKKTKMTKTLGGFKPAYTYASFVHAADEVKYLDYQTRMQKVILAKAKKTTSNSAILHLLYESGGKSHPLEMHYKFGLEFQDYAGDYEKGTGFDEMTSWTYNKETLEASYGKFTVSTLEIYEYPHKKDEDEKPLSKIWFALPLGNGNPLFAELRDVRKSDQGGGMAGTPVIQMYDPKKPSLMTLFQPKNVEILDGAELKGTYKGKECRIPLRGMDEALYTKVLGAEVKEGEFDTMFERKLNQNKEEAKKAKQDFRAYKVCDVMKIFEERKGEIEQEQKRLFEEIKKDTVWNDVKKFGQTAKLLTDGRFINSLRKRLEKMDNESKKDNASSQNNAEASPQKVLYLACIKFYEVFAYELEKPKVLQKLYETHLKDKKDATLGELRDVIANISKERTKKDPALPVTADYMQLSSLLHDGVSLDFHGFTKELSEGTAFASYCSVVKNSLWKCRILQYQCEQYYTEQASEESSASNSGMGLMQLS